MTSRCQPGLAKSPRCQLGSRVTSRGPPDSTATVTPTARLRTRSTSWARALLIYLVVAALAAAAGVGTTLAVQHATAARPGGSQTPRDAAAGQPGAMNDEAVYNEVEPGIVDVTANLRYLQETAEGTGFVIDAAAGLVLTNNHVIDGATNVTVTPVLSGKSYPARVLGYDMTDDVALLQVPGVTGLKAVTLGDSSHDAGGYARAGHRQRGRARRLADGRARGDKQPRAHHRGRLIRAPA